MTRTAMTAQAIFLTLVLAGNVLAANIEITQDEGVNNDQEISQNGDLNQAEIQQFSDDNTAKIEQGSKKSLSFSNLANILQDGTGNNTALIEQRGDGSSAAIMQTVGGSNNAEIKQSNFTSILNANYAVIEQEGAFNDAKIEQKDIDGNQASILQVGEYTGKAEIGQKGGSNNVASIEQVSGTAASNLRHLATIEQGSSKSPASTNLAAIYQQGDGVVVATEEGDILVGHSASISQTGYVNTAAIAQTQNDVSGVALISQDGIGNTAIGIQGSGPISPAVAAAGF